ncbi:MAG TPA: hypothetical protein PLK06_01270 [bacterium]|nr:hypothetical protein [bacterium]
MKKIGKAHRLGLTVGGAMGLWHLSWALLIAVGLAQPLIDFILKLHMIEPFYTVLPFSLPTAVGLVALTSAIGYVVGYVLGYIWEMLQ